MKEFFRNNGLSIVLFLLFALSLVGQFLTGWQHYNDEQREHRQPTVSAVEYAAEGNFWEALFENWESEFLQMAAFVVLTVFLYQKGSAESKKIDALERVDRVLPIKYQEKDSPWLARQRGWIRTVYENSLSLALLLLFLVSFILHGMSGAAAYNEDQLAHGQATVTTLSYMASSRFWFESFQNWQSEFLSIAAMVVLSIFLRQKGSPESKPVDAPHSQTGKG